MARPAAEYLRGFYYDTAISTGAGALAALRTVAEPRRILFGSDHPYLDEELIAGEIRDLEASPLFDARLDARIARENALALFPHFDEAL